MKRKIRRISALAVSIAIVVLAAIAVAPEITPSPQHGSPSGQLDSAAAALENILVKGRAPKTEYSREQFGSGWATVNGCDTRNIILYRDLQEPQLDEECRVMSGVLDDPYTGMTIQFSRQQSSAVQIDHVVALSDAWQKGAQQLEREARVQFANDPLNLLAVDGPANQQKGDGDAATWLPENSSFRCEYIARQVSIKQKYTLWVTKAEKQAMAQILSGCPGQVLPTK
jgi:hypothetical protein